MDLDAGIESWLASRLGDAVADPPSRSTRGPQRDPSDMFLVHPPPDAIPLSGLVVRMIYIDVAEQESERTVRCSKFWYGRASYMLSGFCLLRLEPRTFRMDRVRELVDMHTGELYPVSEFAEIVGVKDGRTAVQDFLLEARQGLKVLMAVANADKAIYGDELEAVLRWADELAFMNGIEFDKPLQDVIVKTIRTMRPTEKQAVEAIQHFQNRPGDARRLVRAIRNVVVADDVVSYAEKVLLRNLGDAASRRPS